VSNPPDETVSLSPVPTQPAAPEPPAGPEPRTDAPDHRRIRPPRRRGAVALVTSLVALVLSVVALLTSWRALDDPSSPPAAGEAPPATGLTVTAPATTEPVPADPNATVPPELPDEAVYTEHYRGETLTLSASRCNDVMYADVDEPRANVEYAGADVELHTGCGTTSPSVFRLGDGVTGSAAGTPNMTPRDCNERIRTAPVAADANIPVRKGVAVCLLTSYPAARARGDHWRLVLLLVTGVADDGAVTVEMNAWNAPT